MITKHLHIPLGKVVFDNPKRKLDKLFRSSSTYQLLKDKKKYVLDLIEELKSHQDTLAKIHNNETSKPVSEVRDEIRRTIDFLSTIKMHMIPDTPRDLLVLAHFTDPIMTSCISMVYAVATRSKVLIHPSTKAAKTTLKLASLVPKSDQWEIVICDQKAVDEFLVKDPRFFRIYVDAYEDIFEKIKEKSAGKEVVGQMYGDQVLVIDTNSDYEKITDAFINQFFLFTTRYGVRMNKILIEDTLYNSVVELIQNKLSIKMDNLVQDDVRKSFSRRLPEYKINKIKELILNAVADGAEVVYGSITDEVESPVFVSKVKTSMSIFSSLYWEPVVLLISYKKGDFPSIVRTLPPKTIYVGNQFTVSWMKEKYYEANTSTIIGVNNSPEHIWDILIKSS